MVYLPHFITVAPISITIVASFTRGCTLVTNGTCDATLKLPETQPAHELNKSLQLSALASFFCPSFEPHAAKTKHAFTVNLQIEQVFGRAPLHGGARGMRMKSALKCLHPRNHGGRYSEQSSGQKDILPAGNLSQVTKLASACAAPAANPDGPHCPTTCMCSERGYWLKDDAATGKAACLLRSHSSTDDHKMKGPVATLKFWHHARLVPCQCAATAMHGSATHTLAMPPRPTQASMAPSACHAAVPVPVGHTCQHSTCRWQPPRKCHQNSCMRTCITK